MPPPNTKRVPFSSLQWVGGAAQYQHPAGAKDASGNAIGGRFVTYTDVRGHLENDITAMRERMTGHARDLQLAAARFKDGNLTGDEYRAACVTWRARHEVEIKNIHLANAAVAKGGFHNLTAADYGKAGAQIKKQYRYSDRRAGVCAEKPDYVLSDRFLRDAGSYADASVGTFEAVKIDADKAAGLAWEFNVLDNDAQHCASTQHSESCPAQTRKGVVKIGVLVPVQGRSCNVRCRCHIHRTRTKREAVALRDGGGVE